MRFEKTFQPEIIPKSTSKKKLILKVEKIELDQVTERNPKANKGTETVGTPPSDLKKKIVKLNDQLDELNYD